MHMFSKQYIVMVLWENNPDDFITWKDNLKHQRVKYGWDKKFYELFNREEEKAV